MSIHVVYSMQYKVLFYFPIVYGEFKHEMMLIIENKSRRNLNNAMMYSIKAIDLSWSTIYLNNYCYYVTTYILIYY